MSSKQPRKQRKVLYKGDINKIRKNVSSHLSKELRKKYKKRSVVLHTGDTVKIMRGAFKGKTGKVTRVNIKKCKAYVEGIEIQKANGQKAKVPLHPSNLMIIELNLADKWRKQKLEGGIKNE